LDSPNGPDRWYGVLGVTGLAPQWFEIDADFFVSEKGEIPSTDIKALMQQIIHQFIQSTLEGSQLLVQNASEIG
jgi:copper resistance protein B